MPRYVFIREQGANISKEQIEAIAKQEISVVDSDLPGGLEYLELKDNPKFWAFSFTIGLGWTYVGLILAALFVLSHLIH